MQTGIIGLPFSGKSTIFKALTGADTAVSSRKGSGPIAEVKVPDDRLPVFAEMFNPKKVIYATVVFRDLPVEFAGREGLADATLAEIRNLDAVALVVRAFTDESVAHPLVDIDPARDLRNMIDSFIFSDLAMAENRLARLVKEGKKGSPEAALLDEIRQKLEEGQTLGRDFIDAGRRNLLSGMYFITEKPIIVIANLGEESADTAELAEQAAQYGFDVFNINAAMEAEIAELPPEEQKEFLQDMGESASARDRFIERIYSDLDLMSFLTVGEDEVRAWTIRRNTTAVKAAGKIHSDLERGFIRAEVISSSDLQQAGSMATAKKQGLLRLEGKDYIVQDGDILNIRFNV